MKIGLAGYGQMGKAVESAAVSKGHTIAFRIDEHNASELDSCTRDSADVVLEFTGPESAFQTIMKLLKAGLPVVSGSTGWLDRLEEVKDFCKSNDGAFFYASNFSLGVNVLFELNKKLADWMSRFDGYQVRMEEVHHTRKKDAPSGTALTLVQGILDHNSRYSGWSSELIPEAGKIPVTSIREGDVTGIHEIRYVSREEVISIRHEAFNRMGLAAGAVQAAEFLMGKKGIYSMKDLLGL